jgi:hypothetical protein
LRARCRASPPCRNCTSSECAAWPPRERGGQREGRAGARSGAHGPEAQADTRGGGGGGGEQGGGGCVPVRSVGDTSERGRAEGMPDLSRFEASTKLRSGTGSGGLGGGRGGWGVCAYVCLCVPHPIRVIPDAVSHPRLSRSYQSPSSVCLCVCLSLVCV